MVYGPDKPGHLGIMSFTKESGGHFKDVECYYSPGLHKVWRQLLSFSLTLVPWNLPSYDCNQNQSNYSQEKKFLWNYLSIQVAIETWSLYTHVSHLLPMLLHAKATYLRYRCLFLPTLFAAFTQTPSSFHIFPVLFSLTTRTKSYQSITLLLDH